MVAAVAVLALNLLVAVVPAAVRVVTVQDTALEGLEEQLVLAVEMPLFSRSPFPDQMTLVNQVSVVVVEEFFQELAGLEAQLQPPLLKAALLAEAAE